MQDRYTFEQQHLRELVAGALESAMAAGDLRQAEPAAFVVETPANAQNGDFAVNAALVNARVFGRSPRDIAAAIVKHLDLTGTDFARAEIAGPGFINFFLGSGFYAGTVSDVLARGEQYGRTDARRGQRINVEYVSANPTGPMHIGNARGGALGDCLASILDAAGAEVTREFYVNDAGNQIAKFGLSLEARYMQIFDPDFPMPENGYLGADITEHAQSYAALHGDALTGLPAEERRDALVAYALPLNVAGLERDLASYGIRYDVWFRESSLHRSGAVQRALAQLTANGKTYEKEGALWLRAPEGDENLKDEVLVRANGIPTYFAADIAYHYNKLVERGFDKAIDIWGADHHGHVARLKYAVSCLGVDPNRLDVVLMQLVRLMSGGEMIKVSKRSGKAITLATLLDEIPTDAARFFFNLREPQSHLDFDLDLAASSTSDNPVYYVQYAHARICSILRAAAEEGLDVADTGDLTRLTEPEEKELIRLLGQLPGEIVRSAASYDPARITRYTVELATLFHKFYNACRVKDAPDGLAAPRIVLCRAVATAIRNCLSMLKISAPERM